ncbi:response regulator [Kallotenue papyrolyticum]|uniref:response regulator n=1 Tax=Kallotenue papyrolyticum TaxID=1325125 RepID=UPI00046FF3B0|nr:response regulator [Kallotenue papyrolyticum]
MAVILIADDEPWLRLWLAQILHRAGHTCSAVADGASVVEYALALDPHLVILDIHLPDIDGVEVAHRLRILPNTQQIPILFITGALEAAQRIAAARIERSACLLKPFDAEDLLHTLRRLLGL